MADWNDLLVLLTFNIAYDTSVFPTERHRVVNLPGCWIFLACTGCRPAEIVDNEKKNPKDGSWEEIYGPEAIRPSDQKLAMGHKLLQFDNEHVAAQVGAGGDDVVKAVPDKEANSMEKMLLTETLGRGRPKALCYEDILLMVVRHPVTGEDVHAMAVKLIHHKGADNKPKPYVLVPIQFLHSPSDVLQDDLLLHTESQADLLSHRHYRYCRSARRCVRCPEPHQRKERVWCEEQRPGPMHATALEGGVAQAPCVPPISRPRPFQG